MKKLFVSFIATFVIGFNASSQCLINAGNDFLICGWSDNLNAYEFAGDYDTHWLPCPGISFSDINARNSGIIAVSYGNYDLIWVTTNSSGLTCSDTVIVTFSERPTCSFDISENVCVGDNCTVTYTGNGDVNSTYEWDFNQANVISGSGQGPYILSWNAAANTGVSLTVLSPEGCFSPICFYPVQVVPAGTPNCCIAPVPNAGPDSSVCGLSYSLHSTYPASGVDCSWSLESGPGSANIYSPNVSNSYVTVSAPGSYVFRHTETSGLCSAYDDVSINFKTGIIDGTVQSSAVTDFSNFKAEIFPDTSFNNVPLFSETVNSNGSFSVNTVYNEGYYLKISATDNNLYPAIADSYYNNEYKWQNATLFINTGTCDTVNVTVPLVTYIPAAGGSCTINGTVRYEGSLLPVSDAMVYIEVQPVDEPVRFNKTNIYGDYYFDDMPAGNYKVYVDMPGLQQITDHDIYISSGDTLFTNINFIVDTNNISKLTGCGIYADSSVIFGINGKDYQSDFVTIFPNPATSLLYINCEEKATVEIINIQGQIVSTKTLSDKNGSIDVSGLGIGVYTLRIKTDNGVVMKKIVKE